jgi:hypothetical protein
MRKDFEKLYTFSKKPEAPDGLFDKILGRIKHEKKIWEIKKKIFIFSVCSIASAAASAAIFYSMGKEISQSGLLQVFSVAFYSPALIASIWDQFVISVLESLPTIKIMLSLTAVLMLLESFKYLVRNIDIITSMPKLKITN